MKPLADRTDCLRQSDIRAISLLLRETNGINLGQGICDLPTPDLIRNATKQAIDENRSIYSPYNGIARLRRAIRDKARAYNALPVPDDDCVMVSVGSTGAFVSTILALVDPGEEVLLFEPFYGYHRNIVQALGGIPVSVESRPPSWDIDFDLLISKISERTKAVVLNTPANPSGKVWSRDDLETLSSILRANDLFAITDEIYEYMLYDGREHVSLGALDNAYDRTITISGFSKTYNMTGWRLGYAVGPREIIAKMGLLNDLMFICAPTPLQYGVTAAFEMGDGYFEQLRRDYVARRSLMCSTLEKIGFELEWPEGSYYAFASFENAFRGRKGFDNSYEASRTVVREAGVGSVAGDSFFADPERGRYYLRFCYAKEMAELTEACNRLLAAYG